MEVLQPKHEARTARLGCRIADGQYLTALEVLEKAIATNAQPRDYAKPVSHVSRYVVRRDQL